VIAILLALDLGVLHRKSHAVKTREAAIWTAVWISLALAFNVAIYFLRGPATALQYLTGYVIEYSLSVDNLFVFVVLFRSFGIPSALQHRVLFWGIMGALVMRGVLIASGAALLERFSWVAYVFGVFLIYTGIKMAAVRKETEHHPELNPAVKLAQRVLRVTRRLRGESFWFSRMGKVYFTPLFLVLIAVEATDLVFALDSIPAIFAVSTDLFVVYTSNVFAILGLRSLYFLLAGAIGKFHYLHAALSAILTFVGIKMLVSHFYSIPIAISLSVILGLLSVAVVASVMRERRLRAAGTANLPG
jgi:tellurite resistance protein TerC